MAARVAELLDLVGLPPDSGERFPHEFSGGQRQRVAIARGLVLEPRLLILDEPVSALDVSVRAQVLNLLRGLQDRLGLSYLFISHDLDIVAHMCRRIAVMYLGRIVETGEAAQIRHAPVHPYTQALVSAVLSADPEQQRPRIHLHGPLPSPLDVPRGCGFHTRCPLARPDCSEREPALTEAGAGRLVACHYPAPIAPPAPADQPDGL
jgi:oligopeptide/dipeptide ABC transporter ATP-binding protein